MENLLKFQHNSAVADGLDGLGTALKYFAKNGLVIEYDKVHKVLGEGNKEVVPISFETTSSIFKYSC